MRSRLQCNVRSAMSVPCPEPPLPPPQPSLPWSLSRGTAPVCCCARNCTPRPVLTFALKATHRGVPTGHAGSGLRVEAVKRRVERGLHRRRATACWGRVLPERRSACVLGQRVPDNCKSGLQVWSDSRLAFGATLLDQTMPLQWSASRLQACQAEPPSRYGGTPLP